MENPGAEIKLSEYVLGLNKLEDEKARSLFLSTAYGSAYGRYLHYYELSMDEPHFHVGMNRMMLPKNISDLYGNWKNGEIIKLHFIEIFWEVTIEASGDDHYIGNGLADFVKDCGIEKNDILVFNAVPPILVRKFYHDNLSKVDTIRCGESTFSVSYNANSRTMKNIQMILEKYGIQRNNTFFLSQQPRIMKANMRIFRRDGIEVEYQSEYATHTINPDHCFLNYPLMLENCVLLIVKKGEDAERQISSDTVEDTNDIGNDSEESIMDMDEFIDDGEESDSDDGEESESDDGIEEADDLILGEFFATLSKCNADTHCHGVYINRDLDAFIINWNYGQIVFLVRNGRQWQIGINVTNGRKRFSARWSIFVKDNGLKKNDTVRFRLRGDGVTFDVEVVVG
ncbi:hypothetical protein POM88_011919 [Heracleum sosnowskyi]|uniref:TF-B3 domain-containing protein n=1 Tax=Heracleum sosnowskyi TaxID=360622 RepID=A0AAD8IXP5_9APIA|nr:hypothetical protein POM88_011919 [Heracleum sosnowskyi]